MSEMMSVETFYLDEWRIWRTFSPSSPIERERFLANATPPEERNTVLEEILKLQARVTELDGCPPLFNLCLTGSWTFHTVMFVPTVAKVRRPRPSVELGRTGDLVRDQEQLILNIQRTYLVPTTLKRSEDDIRRHWTFCKNKWDSKLCIFRRVRVPLQPPKRRLDIIDEVTALKIFEETVLGRWTPVAHSMPGLPIERAKSVYSTRILSSTIFRSACRQSRREDGSCRPGPDGGPCAVSTGLFVPRFSVKSL